jgi:hypothetical protein
MSAHRRWQRCMFGRAADGRLASPSRRSGARAGRRETPQVGARRIVRHRQLKDRMPNP